MIIYLQKFNSIAYRNDVKAFLLIQRTKGGGGSINMKPSPITSWHIDGETKEQGETLFSWAPKSLQMVTAAMKLKDVCSLEEKL